MFPTRWTRARVDPLAREVVDAPTREWASSTELRWSVSLRLCSSGIAGSKLRRPASTWATGMPSFDGGERAGERRVDVAGDDDEIRRRSSRSALDARRARVRSARRGCPSPTPRKTSGAAKPELGEEDVGHLRVVVLPGVDEQLRRRSARSASSARSTGAAFMKFGRAPTTKQTRRGIRRSYVTARGSGQVAARPRQRPSSRRADRIQRLRSRRARRSRSSSGRRSLRSSGPTSPTRSSSRSPRAPGHAASAASEPLPSVVVIVAAHNEETVIERRVANLLALDYPRERLQVVVTSDASDDRTEELAEAAGARVIRNAARRQGRRPGPRRARDRVGHRRVLGRERDVGAGRAAEPRRALRRPGGRVRLRAAPARGGRRLEQGGPLLALRDGRPRPRSRSSAR